MDGQKTPLAVSDDLKLALNADDTSVSALTVAITQAISDLVALPSYTEVKTAALEEGVTVTKVEVTFSNGEKSEAFPTPVEAPVEEEAAAGTA